MFNCYAVRSNVALKASMADGEVVKDDRSVLRDLLISNYDVLARRLVRRVGSIEQAYDVLQETYLRIERVGSVEDMRNPQSYLFKMALNVAADLQRAENRRLTSYEVDDLLSIPDDRPTPLQIVEDRAELELLQKALSELPARRRDIFTQARVFGASNTDLALKHGVTVRTIQLEIKSALEHCALYLERGK